MSLLGKLTIVAISLASISTQASPAQLIINREILVNQINLDEYYFEAPLSQSNCSVTINSRAPHFLQKNTIVEGNLNTLEKHVWKDADNIDRSATTQIYFTTRDGEINISSGCFSHGFLFPASGLPTLRKLAKMTEPFFSIR
jgi:hypothetical protein